MAKECIGGKIEEFDIFTNYGDKKVSMPQGMVELIITESILDNSVRVKYTYADTGYGNDRSTASVEKDDLNLTSAEKVHLTVSDAFETKIVFKDSYQLRIQNVINAQETARNLVNTLYFYSKESIDNELLKNRVVKTYDGKIPNHVYDILKNVLKTPKQIYVDPGLNNHVFPGMGAHPFPACTLLATMCIPDFGPPGKYAGYFFWETSDNGKGTGGYNFKSLDKLTQQKPKLKLVYTDTYILPDGYDMNILTYSFDNTIKLSNILKTGTLVKTQLRTFSTYDNAYAESNFSDPERLTPENIMGFESPKIGTDMNLQNEPTRLSVAIKQDDVSNTGQTLKQQLEVSKGKYINLPIEQITRQSFTRYNNMFAIRLSIQICGRFDLHAGDIIHCDFPEISSLKTKKVSDKKSGLYMIVDVGHRISKNSCYTTLNLTRESIYRKKG
jgi:hypothetical protein